MEPTDQSRKIRIILVTAALALVGFFLEVGPIGNVYELTYFGFGYELPMLGFLAYLALAASAAVGLHFTETEPRPKEEDEQQIKEMQATGQGEAVGERVAVRPELHQLRMLVTALGGYAVLKGLSNFFISTSYRHSGIPVATLLKSFEFGFFYVALGWFVLWQFLRWYAVRHKWVRLQAELVGGDVTWVVAVFIVGKLLLSFYGWFAIPKLPYLRAIITALLHFSLLPAAYLLWTTRPLVLRQTIIALCINGAVIVLLTLLLVFIEWRSFG